MSSHGIVRALMDRLAATMLVALLAGSSVAPCRPGVADERTPPRRADTGMNAPPGPTASAALFVAPGGTAATPFGHRACRRGLLPARLPARRRTGRSVLPRRRSPRRRSSGSRPLSSSPFHPQADASTVSRGIAPPGRETMNAWYWRAVLYGSFLIACLVAIWPPYARNGEPGKIKLGLDLRGGTHLVLQVLPDGAARGGEATGRAGHREGSDPGPGAAGEPVRRGRSRHHRVREDR